jgi:hypothetical protein
MCAVRRFSLLLLLPLLASLAQAGMLDITGETFHTLGTGKTLYAEFGVWNYGANNAGSSPYPATIGLAVIGALPSTAGQFVPGSSETYFPDFAFAVYLESLDGSVSAPFFSSASAALGLPAGQLPLTLATVLAGGDLRQVAVIAGTVSLTPELARELFGSNLNNYNSAARIRIVNEGVPFTLGLGGAYTVGQSISEPGIRGEGPVQTAGIPGPVTLSNPEPSTATLLVLPVAGLFAVARMRRRSSI